MKTKAQFLPPGAAPARWVVRDRVRFLGAVPGSDWVLLEVEVPPGSGTPPHRHESPEVFHVLDGELRIGLFGEQPPREVVATPGAVVSIPAGVPHNYHNAGSAPARTLAIVDRGLEAFFQELGREETPPAGPPSEAELAAVMAACARHRIEILGAPGPVGTAF
jgi:quercetin dioxygenase-like cupin family protein